MKEGQCILLPAAAFQVALIRNNQYTTVGYLGAACPEPQQYLEAGLPLPSIPTLTCSLGFSNLMVSTQDTDEVTTASRRRHLVLQVSTVSPPRAASMWNVGQAGPARYLSIPRLCLALGNLGWADPGSFDLGPGEEEVSRKRLQSHFLQTSFQPRTLHSPLPASSCACSEAAPNNRP